MISWRWWESLSPGEAKIALYGDGQAKYNLLVKWVTDGARRDYTFPLSCTRYQACSRASLVGYPSRLNCGGKYVGVSDPGLNEINRLQVDRVLESSL